ncbi:protein-disulfide reductase DsbD [uncultured Salinisphaera sp.]|uniref:protein-disulfide reductase DsbD n=1 Tax=uncultured Salinisphaera sp. TaxID=359372 RepID=UPI0032B1BDCB
MNDASPDRSARFTGLVVGLLLCLCALSASAQSTDLLPVDQAFQPQAQRLDASTIQVRWQIADGYYLYRHAFDFSLAGAGDARIASADIPTGEKHEDEYFGPVETYRDQVAVRLHVDGNADGAERVKVAYQGCADAGLCYPPQTKTLNVSAASSDSGAADPGPPEPNWTAAQATNTPASVDTPAGTTGRLATRLADAPGLATLALFALLGLGLSLTPCILPMIPIVAGLIGSREVSRGRAAALALSYVLAMALAYAVFGVVAGAFGANIQAGLQRPWVLWPFAGLFVLLGTASFGWFDVQIPGAWQTRLARLGQGQRGLLGGGVLGFAAALIAGPCLAPPLAGALLYISTSGDLWLGGAALFCLGLGMGLPLIALAVFGATVLPRAGRWMHDVRVFFGVMLIAVGLWLALRLVEPPIALAAWGLLALVYGCYLSTQPHDSIAGATMRRVASAVLLGYAALAGLGLAVGQGRPTQPLDGLRAATGSNASPAAARTAFIHVTDGPGLSRALAEAKAAHRPAIVDVYADWCVECVQMKNGLFQRDAVSRALAGVTAIELDITAYNTRQRHLLKTLDVFGPPTLLFFDRNGQARDGLRAVGALDQRELLARLAKLDAS